jgi:hypothetical protein
MHGLDNGRVMLETHFGDARPKSLHSLTKAVAAAEASALADLNQFRKRMKKKRADKRPDQWHVDLENLKAHWHDLHMIHKYLKATQTHMVGLTLKAANLFGG